MANEGILSFSRKTFLRKIGTRKTAREYAHNQAVYAQGDAADSMFYVESGNVKLTVVSKIGKKAVVAILRPGDFFGEGCLAHRAVRISTATSIHQSTIARVARLTLASMIREDPAFAKLFISHLLDCIGRIEECLVDQLFNSSEKRLARTLLLLASFGKPSGPAILKVSQQTLAEMIGTTRARVSFFMNRFRRMGLISYNGNLLVHPKLMTFLLQA
jgi:CRP/FNR family transcriptional regulator, cyclic AMP receptor protein